MNEVESHYIASNSGAVPRSLNNTLNDTLALAALNDTDSFIDAEALTTSIPTEIPLTTTTPEINSTVIGTIVKTVFTMQSIAGLGTDYHSYYIYIWTIGIVGCIIFTTGR